MYTINYIKNNFIEASYVKENRTDAFLKACSILESYFSQKEYELVKDCFAHETILFYKSKTNNHAIQIIQHFK